MAGEPQGLFCPVVAAMRKGIQVKTTGCRVPAHEGVRVGDLDCGTQRNQSFPKCNLGSAHDKRVAMTRGDLALQWLSIEKEHLVRRLTRNEKK
ncbi:hypothetical protein DS909_18725 [Phaeobacter gallaeciensis]|uniref:Uncharacterized protein n=1 Tax=Phaeobacter gallaeciensis TaxID=60890 RepID=A0A366WP51_9RHOB|nr:hypothetical protein DS909_18725 [Phaeobacter gallaeciensis]